MARGRVYSMVYRPNQVMTAMAAAKAAEIAGPAAAKAVAGIPWFVWAAGLGIVGYLIYGATKVAKTIVDKADPEELLRKLKQMGPEVVKAMGDNAKASVEEGKTTAQDAVVATGEVAKTGITVAKEIAIHLWTSIEDVILAVAQPTAISQNAAAASLAMEIPYKDAVNSMGHYVVSWRAIMKRAKDNGYVLLSDWIAIENYFKQTSAYEAAGKMGFAMYYPPDWNEILNLRQNVNKGIVPMVFPKDLEIGKAKLEADKTMKVKKADLERFLGYLKQMNDLIQRNQRTWSLPITGRGAGVLSTINDRVKEKIYTVVE